MSERRVSLCPECTACPEVVFRPDGRVEIGEAPGIATLEPRAWNVLVRLIREGALAEVPVLRED